MTDDLSTKKLRLNPVYLGLLALPMLVLLLSEAMLSAFADPGFDASGVALDSDGALRELAGRYRFLAAFLFYVSCCAAVWALFLLDLGMRYARRVWALAVGSFVLLVGFSIIFSVLEPAWMGSFEAHELLGAAIFEQGLKPATAPICAAGMCGDQGAFFVMDWLLHQTNWISALAVSAVIVGMILCLAGSNGPLGTAAEIAEEGARLREAQKQIRRYLYLAGLLLSIGMIMGLAWMKWPAELIVDQGMRAEFLKLVDAISLYRGVSYSVLILSFYMPVSLLLMYQIERYDAARMRQGGGIKVAEAVQGFDLDQIGSLDSLKAIVSILAPVLASAIGKFVDAGLLG